MSKLCRRSFLAAAVAGVRRRAGRRAVRRPRPATPAPEAAARTDAALRPELTPSSCTGCWSATSRCSAASRSSPPARTTRPRARPAAPALARRAHRNRPRHPAARDRPRGGAAVDRARSRCRASAQLVTALSAGERDARVRGARRRRRRPRRRSSARSRGPRRRPRRSPRRSWSSTACSRTSPTRPRRSALVGALAEPYPNVAEAHFAVALAGYATGLSRRRHRRRLRGTRSIARWR